MKLLLPLLLLTCPALSFAYNGAGKAGIIDSGIYTNSPRNALPVSADPLLRSNISRNVQHCFSTKNAHRGLVFITDKFAYDYISVSTCRDGTSEDNTAFTPGWVVAGTERNGRTEFHAEYGFAHGTHVARVARQTASGASIIPVNVAHDTKFYGKSPNYPAVFRNSNVGLALNWLYDRRTNLAAVNGVST